MAEVHTADDLVLDRLVVVKLVAPDADRSRFEREARAAAALAHPNIVQLFDFGEQDGRAYMVFEHLPGGSLEERLSEAAALPDDETARIATDIAGGLAHAHDRGVVHRDLKPANVLFDAEKRAKIADFGIALLRGADTLTDAGTVLGTAAYISPEQVRGEPATPASDVYSFGVVLYRMLAGRLPFESDNPTELAAMHRDTQPPSLAASRSDAPRELATLALAALAKAPSGRPPDGAALLHALGAHDSGAAIGEADTRVMAGAAPRRRLAPAPLAAAVVLVLLAAAGVLVATALTNEPASTPGAPVDTVPAKRTSMATTAQRTGLSSSSTSTSTYRTTTEPATAPSAPTRSMTTATAPTAATTATTETTVPSTAQTTATTP